MDDKTTKLYRVGKNHSLSRSLGQMFCLYLYIKDTFLSLARYHGGCSQCQNLHGLAKGDILSAATLSVERRATVL